MRKFFVMLSAIAVLSWFQSEPAIPQKITFRRPSSTLLPLEAGKNVQVRVNGNWATGDIPTADHATFTTGSEAWREFLMVAHGSRIRQSGDVEKIVIAWGSTKPDTITVKFWRWVVGSKYALVGITQNLSGDLTVSDTTTVVLSPRIAVAQGDYYSIHVANGAAGSNRKLPNSFVDNGASAGPPGEVPVLSGGENHNYGMFFTRPASSAFPSGNYHWGNQGQGDSQWLQGEYIPVEFYMKAPQVVILGASIITGHNEHYSFFENRPNDSTGTEGLVGFILNDSSTTAMDSMPAWYICGTQVLDVSTTWPYTALVPDSLDNVHGDLGYAADVTGWTYQNMGKGSDTAATLLNTITRRMTAISPRLAFIGVGSADVDGDIAVSAHVASMTEIMDTLDAHSVIGVFRGIVPRTKWVSGDTHTQRGAKHDSVIAYNRAVRATIDNYQGANLTQMFYVPVYHVLGERDPDRIPSGPSGNNYSNLITRIANTDTIHLNSRGAMLMSEMLIRALRRPSLARPVD